MKLVNYLNEYFVVGKVKKIMSRSLSSVLLVVVFCLACVRAVWSSDPQGINVGDWKKKFSYDGITVSEKYFSDSSTYSYKAVGRVKVNDLYALVALIEDYNSYPEWLGVVSHASELSRESSNSRYLYSILKFPLLQDRDLVLLTTITQDRESKSVTIIANSAYDRIPLDERYLRMPVYDCTMRLDVISDTEVEFTYAVRSVFGGVLPTRMINFATALQVHTTIQDVREVMSDPQYHNRQSDISVVSF